MLSDLKDVEIIPGNVLKELEAEIGIGLKPSDFAARASITITAKQARAILLGILVPATIIKKH